MRKKLLFMAVAILLSGVLGYFALTRSSTGKLFQKQIYGGFNQVFPVSDGSLTIYNGHGFIKYQGADMVAVSPDTGAALSYITVSSDGSTAVAYAEYVDNSDVLATNFGVYSNSWALFNLEEKTASKINTESSHVFALNNQGVAVLHANDEINDKSKRYHFVVTRGSVVNEFATFSGLPSQVREQNNSLIVKIAGVTKNSIYRADKNSSELIADTSRRSSLSLDGEYYYSIDYANNNTELTDRSGKLNVYSIDSKKHVSSNNISSGATIYWSGNNLLAETNVREGRVTVTAYPSKDQTKYLISGNLSGFSIALNDGILNISGRGIQKTSSSPVDKTNIENPIAERLGSDYSIHITGGTISVYVHDATMPIVFDQIKKELGEDYLRTGFIFIPQTEI